VTRLKAIVLRAGGVVVGLLLTCSAFGVLYLIRGPTASWPGPKVAEALPLDELPGHDAVNVIAFLLVWGVAAALLGTVCRSLGVERLVAAVVLGLGVGGFAYGLSGFSVYLVRGLSRHQILHVPADIRAVYVAPALAGIAGGLLGRPGRSRSDRPWVLVWLIGAAGLIDVASAVTPEIKERLALVERFVPGPVPPLASAVVVPIGFALVLSARGLFRRKRRAWQLALALLAGSSLLHLLKGLDYEEATITGLLALALFARRQDFVVPGDPEGRPRLAARAGLLVAAICFYGAVAVWLNQALADRPYSLAFAMAETTRALVGISIAGSSEIHGSFGSWFPLSVFLAGAVAFGWLVMSWLAPWRYRRRSEAGRRELVRSLVRSWGTDALAPFVLRPDKTYFLGAGNSAVMAYTVVGGVAVVSGDPIGPPDAVDPLLGSFVTFAHQRDWRVTVLGASERCRSLYRKHGLRCLYHGDEAVIETSAFSLEGRPIRKVRQAVNRLERAAYAVEVQWPEQLDAELRADLEGIVAEWRGDQPNKGFAMCLDSPFGLDGRDALFVCGRDAAGRAQGFLHLVVCAGGSTLSLSSMPRRRSTPNGFNEWLISHAVEWGREHGFRRLSLNFAPFAALLDPAADLSGLQRLERDALLALKARLHLQLDNLLMFCNQFQPTWQKRFLVYERLRDLPRVGIAALRAEGYLPFGPSTKTG
jgi:lysyl-tRNA synthetase, class II